MVAHGFVALYLISVLAVPRVSTSLAALACLVALAAGWRRWKSDASAAFRHMAVLVVPAALYLLHLMVQILTGTASTSLASQLLIGLLALTTGLSGVPNRMPDLRRWLLPAAAVGAVATCALALYQVQVLGYLRPYGWLGGGPLGNGAIKFGDIAVVQALLSFVLVLTAGVTWHRLLGLAGLFGGILALALTQTRGGILGFLLAVTVLALALALRARREKRAIGDGRLERPVIGNDTPERRAIRDRGDGRGTHDPGLPVSIRAGGAHAKARRGTTAVLLVFALVLSFSAAGFMQERFAQIEPQIRRYLHGDLDSEVGQRLALWRAAVRAGMQAPITGVGFGGFGEELERQYLTGVLPAAKRILYRQPHSEYLAAFAEAGVSGLLSLFLMFVAPVFALVRQIAAGRGSPAAFAALVTAAAFAGFALTDDIFDRQITVIAFFLLNAWFLRAAWPLGSAGGVQRVILQ